MTNTLTCANKQNVFYMVWFMLYIMSLTVGFKALCRNDMRHCLDL